MARRKKKSASSGHLNAFIDFQGEKISLNDMHNFEDFLHILSWFREKEFNQNWRIRCAVFLIKRSDGTEEEEKHRVRATQL